MPRTAALDTATTSPVCLLLAGRVQLLACGRNQGLWILGMARRTPLLPPRSGWPHSPWVMYNTALSINCLYGLVQGCAYSQQTSR